jgi:peptidoglycan-N-acetylglucosamine deacetylase
VGVLIALVAAGVYLGRPSSKGGGQLSVAGGGTPGRATTVPTTVPATTTPPTTLPKGDDSSGTLPAITPPVPGAARVVSAGPANSTGIALTFDDGYCDPCVAGLVAGVERTGAHVTFCPNGVYGPATWDKYAARIKALIAKGEVAICNHTWDHHDLTKMTADQITTELTRNEQWIEQTFGVTSRPFYRPPYGYHNAVVDRIAAQLGFTNVIMWAGSLGDSSVETPQVILDLMKQYDKPGFIILSHANHPATADEFDAVVRVATQTGLHMMTLTELLKPGSPVS